MPHAPLLSIVISFRNEADVLPALLDRLRLSLATLPLDYELVFVDDASTDGSPTILLDRAAVDDRVKIVTMSRRFGPAEGMLAGMRYARGDALVTIDADLQDPPELIPELVAKWLDGADVVYTVRRSRAGEGWVKTRLTRLAYRAIRAIADVELPVEAGTFRLVSRRVADQVLRLPESDPYLRGLVSWVGFRQVPVLYDRDRRFAGQSHFPLFSRNPFREFLSGLTSFSILPLLALLPLGLLSVVAALGGLVGAGLAVLYGARVSTWWWAASGIALLAGLQLVATGILGLYVGRIYNDVKHRPRYIVASTLGFGEAEGLETATPLGRHRREIE
jgi:dolichol-phosphate mannosyltransferase